MMYNRKVDFNLKLVKWKIIYIFKGQEHVKPNFSVTHRPMLPNIVRLEGVFPLALVTVGIGPNRF